MWACVTLLFFPAKAERVSIEKAEKIARSYARVTPRLTARKAFQLSRTVSKPVRRNHSGLQPTAQRDESLYYVFTMNGNGGFIVVSGDDVAKPILGYSDEGTFDESNPNLAYWMETLAQEIADAIENDVQQDAPTKADWDVLSSDNSISISPQASGDYIDPLVKTKWNQGAPYNKLCPSQRYTGCVATAMAQIMNYHRHPTTRTVTIPAYTTLTDKIVVPAVTGTTNYAWNNMTNTYTTSSTGASANAVATLMYHCGVSVEMDYKSNESGAYSSDVSPALKTYFGYDAGIAYCSRDYYTYAEWINLLKTEIRANRPVYYAGNGGGGGHAFVCDGYDTDDLFHFNWGWGGSSDGYFELSALNPKSLGIGGGAGGYNRNQDIITGIQPNAGSNEQDVIQLGLSTVSADKTSLTSLTQTFSVAAGTLTNTGIVTITNVYLGVLLYNQDGSLRSYTTTSRTTSGWVPGSYYPSLSLVTNYELPSGLPVGTYTLYPAYSASSGMPSIIPGKNGDRYILVEVKSASAVTLTGTVAALPELSLTALNAVGNLYQNKTGSFEAEITNSGAADYNSNMSLKLGSQTVATDPVVIPAGTAKTVGFSGAVTLLPGNYSLSVLYSPNNVPGSTPSTQLGNAVSPVEVKATPTGTPSLSLVSASFQSGNNAVPRSAPNLTVQINNADGLFNERVNVYVYSTSGGSSIGSFGATNVLIGKGETKSILFNSPIDFLTAGTQYMACVNYISNSTWHALGNLIYFTVAPPSSDATLKSLVVKDAQTQTLFTLGPAFTPSNTSYTALADITTNKISIIGEASHKRATFTNVENEALNGGCAFEIEVTAEDGTTKKTYTIGVIIEKTPQAAPATPELDKKTSVSITLKTISGAKYAKALTNTAPAIPDGGWQDSREFTGLTPNTTYYFFAYYPETATQLASVASAGLQENTSNDPSLINLAIGAGMLTPSFDPNVTAYTVTLPCDVNNFTVTATPAVGSTVTYSVNNATVTSSLNLNNPGITTMVIQTAVGSGENTKDYTITIIRPFDVSIIRAYWNDVLAVNLNTATNGGYTFSGFQWTRNGQNMANETGPYLYFPISPATSDRYSVLLTTGEQTLPVCSGVQVTPAAVQQGGLLAYPNPARHTVTLENPQWETAKQTDLINLSGNVVRSYPSAHIQTLNVSGLPVGLYILRADVQTVKIVIE
jgi:hypothetical protein